MFLINFFAARGQSALLAELVMKLPDGLQKLIGLRPVRAMNR